MSDEGQAVPIRVDDPDAVSASLAVVVAMQVTDVSESALLKIKNSGSTHSLRDPVVPRIRSTADVPASRSPISWFEDTCRADGPDGSSFLVAQPQKEDRTGQRLGNHFVSCWSAIRKLDFFDDWSRAVGIT